MESWYISLWDTSDNLKFKAKTATGSTASIYPRKEGEMLTGFSWVVTREDGKQLWSDKDFDYVYDAMEDLYGNPRVHFEEPEEETEGDDQVSSEAA